MDVSGENIMVGIAVVIALVELGVAVVQFRLAQKLKAKVTEALAEKATKEDLRKVEEATKEDLRKVEDSIGETVRRRVPEVLREMAQQYAKQYANSGSADQQGSSGADFQ